MPLNTSMIPSVLKNRCKELYTSHMDSKNLPDKPSPLEVEEERERSTKRLVILTIRLLFITFMFAAAILPFIAGLNAVNRPIDEVIIDHLGPLISTIAFAVIVLVIDLSLIHISEPTRPY